MKRINRLVFNFKEIFWNELKNFMIFISFLLVMVEFVLPNAGLFWSKFFSILVVLIAISFALDKLYSVGILPKPKELNKKKVKKK